MLHLPMEPSEYPSVDPGPGALLSSMSADELLSQLRKHLDEVPGIKGVNNHMGSKLTAESTRIYQIFSILKQEGLFFIDILTLANGNLEHSTHLDDRRGIRRTRSDPLYHINHL